MTSRYSFPRKLRLLKPKEFRTVFEDAQYKASHQGILFLARTNGLGYPRLGFVFSRRSINLASKRNRVKRVIRDYFRLNQLSLPQLDVVTISRRPLADMDNKTVRKVISQLLSKLERQYEKKTGVRKP